MTPQYSLIPSNYDFLKKLRLSKKASLKPCFFIKESTKLRPYQTIGTAHLLCLNRMVLGDNAGLGKTIMGITAYAFLLERDPTLKLLVVTPKSAVDQWKEEFLLFSKDIKIHVMTNEICKMKNNTKYGSVDYMKKHNIPYNKLIGFQARKVQYDYSKANVLIASYYHVQEDYDFIVQNRLPKYMIIFDECQAFKNRKTKTYFGADTIALKAARVYGFSATLIKNKLEEAYNIYRIIVPGIFGGVTKFNKTFLKLKKIGVFNPRTKRKRFFNKIEGYKNINIFRDTIDPYFLLRKAEDVADELPAVISKKVTLEMTEEQTKLYQLALSGNVYRERARAKYFNFKTYYDALAVPSEKDKKELEKYYTIYQESLTKEGMQKNKISALSYCQLASNGPQWLGSSEVGESSKEIEFKRLFEEELFTEKTIVFTRFKSGIPRLKSILDDLKIKYTEVTGDTSQEDRTKARLDFQDLKKGISVIFITFAGNAALNLQAGNIILFYDTPWSYGDLYQTIGRAQRIGNIHKNVHVIHMVNKRTIDEHVIKVLEGKKNLIRDVMGDIAKGAIEFNAEVTPVDSIVFKDGQEEGAIDALYNSVFKEAV